MLFINIHNNIVLVIVIAILISILGCTRRARSAARDDCHMVVVLDRCIDENKSASYKSARGVRNADVVSNTHNHIIDILCSWLYAY